MARMTRKSSLDADNHKAVRRTTRLCRECASEIPLAARKCKNCGSFQDFRRFTTVSQSSVTFLLALAALIAHFTSDIRSGLFALRDWLSGTNFSMSVGLVELTNENLTVILTSRRDHAIGVSGGGCFIHLPADPSERSRVLLEQRSLGQGELERLPPDPHAWIGPIMLSYDLESPELLQPLDQKMISLALDLVGFPGTEITWSDEAPTSFCSISGGDQHNSLAVSAFIAKSDDFSTMDALQILTLQTGLDASSGEDQRRLRLIDEISRLRADNSQRRALEKN